MCREPDAAVYLYLVSSSEIVWALGTLVECAVKLATSDDYYGYHSTVAPLVSCYSDSSKACGSGER